MLNKQRIGINFSRGAADYDQHARLQKEMADQLLERIKGLSPLRVLDIGCGTGYMTRQMAAMFPRAEVIGIDIAPGMIEEAKKRARERPRFISGDGERLAFPDHCFDLIVSNATFQWMAAERALAEAGRTLKRGGRVELNTFGPETLKELKAAGFTTNELNSVEELRDIAARFFKEVRLTRRIVEQRFSSVKELILHLKKIGAQTRSEKSKGYLRRRLDQPITATFEIISGSLAA